MGERMKYYYQAGLAVDLGTVWSGYTRRTRAAARREARAIASMGTPIVIWWHAVFGMHPRKQCGAQREKWTGRKWINTK